MAEHYFSADPSVPFTRQRVRGVLVTLHINWAELDLTAAEPAAEAIVEELAPRLACVLAGSGD